MQIEVASQRMLLLKDQLSPDQAKEKAWAKKVSAFDAVSKVTSFLSKPRDEDFTLTYSEHRYEPFFHVIAQAHYEYTRTTNYQVPASAKEVKTVTLNEKKYDVLNGHIHVPVEEYCLQDEREESIIDGITGKAAPQLKTYLAYTPLEVAGQLRDEVGENAILIPPQARMSAIMRDSLSKMITGIQADAILAEQVEISRMDVYYRPTYAFKYNWISKQKEAILEVDGLTGEVRPGTRVFTEFFGKALDQAFLFDVGADAVGIFIPGGSIAVKAAKKYIETRNK